MSFLEVRNIKKVYPAGHEHVSALNGITSDVAQGEFIAVTGPSGSGKSTLLSILGGLNHPTEGTLIADGIDVYGLSVEQRANFRREYLGFVFQSFQLIPYLTVNENVSLPLTVSPYSNREQKEMALGILEKVGLDNKSRRLPDELSGGEQQRVAIARALINQPPILLADEPTGNLDSVTSEEIMKLFQALNGQGITMIMVTHNPENVKYVQRCINLRDGRITMEKSNRKQPHECKESYQSDS